LSPKRFPRWAILVSIILTIISVGTTLLLIVPIHLNLEITGLTETVQSQLLPLSIYFQIIPSTLQVIITIMLLNIYLNDTKLFSRWLFILFFGLLFYSVGPGFVETSNYRIWTAIGEKDWLSFRLSGVGASFFGLFLIPSVLPMFLSILLFWWRPKGFSSLLVLIFLLTQIGITLSTVTYFVPKIQLPLDKAFSLSLINDLNSYNFLYRGIVAIIGQIVIIVAFLKISHYKKNQQIS
jgi:hypothetical protein